MAARTSYEYDHHKGSCPLLRSVGRWRLGLFLLINLSLFGAANVFWCYLSSGRWLGFSHAAFMRGITTPIGQTFTAPLNILTHPWMIPVFGLLLAVIAFVPVVVSVLYRLSFAMMFVVLVAFLGQAPTLALVLAVGCILAARTSLRSDMPFLAAVLGMLPVAGYLFGLGFVDLDSAAALPLQRWVLYGPFLIAVIAAVLAAAVVLALARVTKFRPGVLWPVLALLLAGPITLFYLKTGPDELEYCLIVRPLAPGDAIFGEESLESWRSQHGEGLNEQTLTIGVKDDLARRRAKLVGECEDFVRRYPMSKRAAIVLWVEAQCRSLRLDARALAGGVVKHTAGYVLPESKEIWQRLRDNHGGTPQAVLAQWRLGQLALREQRTDEAYDLLTDAARKLRDILSKWESRSTLQNMVGVFSEADNIPAYEYYGCALSLVERSIWLMAKNDVLNNARSAEALAALLNVNQQTLSRKEHYQCLNQLALRYESTPMGRNIILEAALAETDLTLRAKMLNHLAGQQSDIDAAIRANYELGKLLVPNEHLKLLPDIEPPAVYFRRVVQGPPSPWSKLAAEELLSPRTTTQPKAER